jgi:hypothetical protein
LAAGVPLPKNAIPKRRGGEYSDFSHSITLLDTSHAEFRFSN